MDYSKKEFTKFGINSKDIINYKSIDAAVIARRKILDNDKIRSKKNGKKIILVRVEEEYAAYSTKKRPAIPIIKEIIKNFSNEEIIVMGRYASQARHLEQVFGKKIKVLSKVIDSKTLLKNADVFIGSGGTMTAESALLGIPTISYNAIPNIVETYLVKKKLVIRETNPKQIVNSIEKTLESSNLEIKKRSKKILNSMKDPYFTLVKTMKSV